MTGSRSAAILFLASLLLFNAQEQTFAQRPNVIVIMSDDQGCGDYGFMGNRIIRTPQLDQMATRGAVMTRFHVSSVCAPTRASLMTGRYNYRTRCIDTFQGRAMMDTDEVTIAEYLREADYNTGIYGKWHLGDNYPMRAMDQGFDDSLVHRGGGIGQNSDPIGAEGKYTDPTLIKNGIETPIEGYCTDIYFDAAMEFISNSVNEKKNFFAYIATNAPHGPFHDVPTELYQQYKQVDLRPIMLHKNPDEERFQRQTDILARISAMITNIDDNVGRLLEKLDSLGVTDDTLVIYLNDNGPNSKRFVGELRGMKTDVHDGGIRSSLIAQWPAKIKSGLRSDAFAAHIDLLPTLLEACGVSQTRRKQKIDGRSFLPLITGGQTDWPERPVVFQAHRGNEPFPLHHFALHKGPWKLVHPSGFGKISFEGEPKLELYKLDDDPGQANNLAQSQSEKLDELKNDYLAWFKDVGSTRPNNYASPRIIVGTDHEPVTVLTRQDWRLSTDKPVGHWLLEAAEARQYRAEIIMRSRHEKGIATVNVGGAESTLEIAANEKRGHFVDLSLPAGKMKLEVTVSMGESTKGPQQVILSRK